jgi:hypothetical protein
LLGFVLAAAIFELALRLAAASPWWWMLPAVSAQFDRPDPELGYAHRPNVEGLWLRENRVHVRINSQGLRDRPREQIAAPGTMRIAIAGDSITEALQVEESDLFTLRAERTLTARGVSAEVLNFGLAGATPLQQLLFVVHRGLPIGVNGMVMLASAADFVAPLIRDDSAAPAYVEDSFGNLVIGRAYRDRRSHRFADRWPGRLFFWLVDHSLVADMLYLRFNLGFFPPGAPARAAVPDQCAQARSSLEQLDALLSRGEPQWAGRRLDRFISDIAKLLDDKPVVLALRGLAIPAGCPGMDMLQQQVVRHAGAKLEPAGIGFFDFDSAVMAKLIKSADWPRMFGFGRRLGTGHLNPFGHEIYSQVLADVIVAKFADASQRAR